MLIVILEVFYKTILYSKPKFWVFVIINDKDDDIVSNVVNDLVFSLPIKQKKLCFHKQRNLMFKKS
jgi:hypothetical protein